MQSALDYAHALSPKALIRSVTNTGALLTRRVLFPPIPLPQRPFRVSNNNRSQRKGIVASTLKELIEKAIETLLITASVVTLVLEEDGTVVETEEFFQSLKDNTNFLLLEEGQKWTQGKKATTQQIYKRGIVNITLDFYKLSPKDFIGCLNIKATFYETYTVSCDLQCLGAKKLIRAFVRILSHLVQVVGHFLLYCGTVMMQMTEGYEERTFRRGQNSQRTC